MTKRTEFRLCLILLLAAGAALAPALSLGAPETPPPLSLFFETQLPYFYEGDPIPVAMTIKNLSDRSLENSKGIDLLGGLVVEDARGGKVKPAEGHPPLLTQPQSIEKGAFFGRVVEINEVFPALGKQGNYKLTWKGTEASSNSLILHVVERYDPKKDYRARIETDFGPITIEFFKETAPRHVRNFIDLVRQGFYNGNQFHRVIPGQAIVGGSPTGDPAAGAGYNLDPEPSRQEVTAGTVLQIRNRETGADDSGSHIMITAIAKPDLRGRLTVMGRVVEGLDTVRTICQVPTEKDTANKRGGPERPVKPILIRKATITEISGKIDPEKGGGGKKDAAKKQGS